MSSVSTPMVLPVAAEALHSLACSTDTETLVALAGEVRDKAFGSRITYSRKVFIPLTQLCRDVCHYCTFAKAPRKLASPYLSLDEVLALAREGKAAGCKEALLTLGERPELRYRAAAEWLAMNGYESTIDYVAAAASRVLAETGLLPHINAGTMDASEIDQLRSVSASMGIMLETASPRLSKRGMPHYGSPDKFPARRLETLEKLGAACVPTTTGILIGIGETEAERIDSILAIKDLSDRFGHIQEVIVQNFRSKPGTRMASHPEPSPDVLIRSVALARVILGGSVSIQVPPNLNPDSLAAIVEAGIDDWGGISPVTIDHVNPEAPWPHLDRLSKSMDSIGRALTERLTIYPAYLTAAARWLDPALSSPALRLSDAAGLGRECDWRAGEATAPSQAMVDHILNPPAGPVSRRTGRIVDRAAAGYALQVAEIQHLFHARGADLAFICRSADTLRRETNGDVVSYVVTRNINYTNVCTYGCRFCAFSKGKTHADLRGRPYDISLDEVMRRSVEAWQRGATEVCMQGGINPRYTGETYIGICAAVKDAVPQMHVHAFSPLEVMQGARTLGLPVGVYLQRLKAAGLGSLPGTAAEILDDEVRATLCADKLSTGEWLSVMQAAHEAGLRTTATIMFGHVERPVHWARHIARIRELQDRTGGFTEFVPLPFVAREAPMYLKGMSRPGPTFRETALMHAVARIAFHKSIANIQASWVKLGPVGVDVCLSTGVNDLGGTLMNESITRAAGAVNGQEASPETIEGWIRKAGRMPRQRTTLYADAPAVRRLASYNAPPLAALVNDPYRKAVQFDEGGGPVGTIAFVGGGFD